MLSNFWAFIRPCVIAIIFSVLIPVNSYSQEKQFNKNQLDYNLGLGIISTLGGEIKQAGYKSKPKILPISFSVDYGLGNRISLGGYFCFAQGEVYYHTHYYFGSVTHYIIGARGIYHYDQSARFDHYVGLMLGYDNQQVDDTLKALNMRKIAYSIFAGTKFRISERVRGFVEVGLGVSLFNFGVSLKTYKQKPAPAKTPK